MWRASENERALKKKNSHFSMNLHFEMAVLL